MTRSCGAPTTRVASRAWPSRQRALLLLLATLPALPAHAADRFVLPPEAGDAVREAFRRAAPDFTLAAATLDDASVRARACRPDGSCLDLVLTHAAGCDDNERFGPFCPAATPPLDETDHARLAAAFAPVPADLWKRSVARPPDADLTVSREPPPATPTSTDAWVLYATALLFGVLVGRIVRQPAARRSLFLLVFVLLAATCTLRPLPPFDALAAWLLAVTTAGLVASKRPKFAIPVTLSSLAVSLALLEVTVRFALPTPLEPGPTPPFWLDQTAQEDLRCLCLDGTVDPTRRDPEPPAPRTTVLHLGDSMILANGLPAGQRATDLLERDPASTLHRNAGIAGTGPDVAALLTPGWLSRYSPRAVVVHLFAGNDLVDVSIPLRCCPDGPLLVETPQGMAPRCRVGVWSFSPVSALEGLRAPYPVLAAASVLQLARHAAYATRVAGLELARGYPKPRTVPAEQLTKVLAHLARTLEAAGRKVAFVVLPERRELRDALAGGHPGPPLPYETVLTAARASGVEVVDAWPYFLAATRTHGDALFMQTIDDDPHFSALGHAEYAKFLAALPLLAE